MRHFPTAQPPRNEVRRWVVWAALAVAMAAMAALHVIQPELDPIAEPLSFYVWGRHGWLLPVALGAFGMALLAHAGARADPRSSGPSRLLAVVGAALLLTALVPSDRWFPWEGPATLSGLVHAAAAMVAPIVLAWPMVAWASSRDRPLRRALPWLVGLYLAGLMGSAASLALGFLRDTSPPSIGLLERVLAAAAVGWVGALAWSGRAE